VFNPATEEFSILGMDQKEREAKSFKSLKKWFEISPRTARFQAKKGIRENFRDDFGYRNAITT